MSAPVLAVFTFVAGLGVGVVIATGTASRGADTAVATALPQLSVASRPTSTTPRPTTTSAALPAPGDFTIAVNVLSEKCFGSAGCNVTYQIEPTYVGSASVDSLARITVVYEVRGGEQPQTDRFTLQGGTASFSREESISTRSDSAELTAVPVQVLRG